MKEPQYLQPPPGPLWVQLLIGLSVIAVLVIVGVTGVGVDIAFAAVAVAEIAGFVLLTIIRAHRHNDSFRVAAAAVLRRRWRLEPRSRRPSDRADPSNRRQ